MKFKRDQVRHLLTLLINAWLLFTSAGVNGIKDECFGCYNRDNCDDKNKFINWSFNNNILPIFDYTYKIKWINPFQKQRKFLPGNQKAKSILLIKDSHKFRVLPTDWLKAKYFLPMWFFIETRQSVQWTRDIHFNEN